MKHQRLAADALLAVMVATVWSVTVGLVPWAGMPIVNLLALPLSFIVVGATCLLPVAFFVTGEAPTQRRLWGIGLAVLGAMALKAAFWLVFFSAHEAALAWNRGTDLLEALLSLGLPCLGLLPALALFAAAGVVSGRLRIWAALPFAAVLVGVAPATVCALFGYVSFGLPLTA